MIVTNSKSVMKYLMNLPLLIHVLEETEIETYDVDARKIMVDSTVLLPVDSDEKEVKCFNWWIQVSSRFPTFFKRVTPILLIFHRSQVENMFSKMDQVLDEKSGYMDVRTQDAIQSVHSV